MIRVLIADDHAIVRQGLKQILADCDDMEVAAEAENGLQAVQQARTHAGALDIALLDVSMPGKSGIDALKLIREEIPGLPVLILSMYPEDQYAVRLIKAGASGYMTKESAPQELVSAIRKVAAGKKYISPNVAEMLADEVGGGNNASLHASLSDREYHVMIQLASGKTVSGIAEEMNLSAKTISTYRSRILVKMRLKNNAELTHYAITHQLA